MEEEHDEELNIYASCEGEPTRESAGVATTIRELEGAKPGELVGAMDNACEGGESKQIFVLMFKANFLRLGLLYFFLFLFLFIYLYTHTT